VAAGFVISWLRGDVLALFLLFPPTRGVVRPRVPAPARPTRRPAQVIGVDARSVQPEEQRNSR